MNKEDNLFYLHELKQEIKKAYTEKIDKNDKIIDLLKIKPETINDTIKKSSEE